MRFVDSKKYIAKKLHLSPTVSTVMLPIAITEITEEIFCFCSAEYFGMFDSFYTYTILEINIYNYICVDKLCYTSVTSC